MKVLLASRNPGKLREFAELLPWELLSWPASAPEIPKTGAFLSVSPAAIRETSSPAQVPARFTVSMGGSGAP